MLEAMALVSLRYGTVGRAEYNPVRGENTKYCPSANPTTPVISRLLSGMSLNTASQIPIST